MSKGNNKVAIGGFVLGAIAFLVVCVMTLGGKSFFSEDMEYVLYFDGSVRGLSLGAQVVFKGVPLGTVTKIQLVADGKSEEMAIPVYISINANSIALKNVANDYQLSSNAKVKLMDALIQRGLRARLQMRSMVTGVYDIELDFYPQSPARYHSEDHTFEIPTIASTLDEFQRTLSSLPLEEIAHSLNEALEGIAKLTTSEDLYKSLKAMRSSLENIAEFTSGSSTLRNDLQRAINSLGDTSVTIDTQLPEVMMAIQFALNSVSAVAQELKQTVVSANKVVSPNSKTLQEVHSTLDELKKTAKAFRELARLLEKNPEALLLGKGSKK